MVQEISRNIATFLGLFLQTEINFNGSMDK